MDCSDTYSKDSAETNGGSKDGESGSTLNRFVELPEDVIANILRRLGGKEILKNAQRVCSLWRRICRDPSMWCFIDVRSFGDYEKFDALCREAVDRSQGQLTELHIEYFDTVRFLQLLDYISQRSSNLRCLQITDCDRVRDGLIKATKRFHQLEELHFLDVIHIQASIEPIGQSCPRLKSFTLNSSNCKGKFWGHADDNEYYDRDTIFVALPIAKSMPGLRHLRLVRSNMTSKGLEAILDGCPNLESLDIRKCFNVWQHGGIADRIAREIKDFKLPHDPMELSYWEAVILGSYSGSDSDDEFDSYYW